MIVNRSGFSLLSSLSLSSSKVEEPEKTREEERSPEPSSLVSFPFTLKNSFPFFFLLVFLPLGISSLFSLRHLLLVLWPLSVSHPLTHSFFDFVTVSPHFSCQVEDRREQDHNSNRSISSTLSLSRSPSPFGY